MSNLFFSKTFFCAWLQLEKFAKHNFQRLEIEGIVLVVVAVACPPGQLCVLLVKTGVTAMQQENLLGGAGQYAVPGERWRCSAKLVAHHDARQLAVLSARLLDVFGRAQGQEDVDLSFLFAQLRPLIHAEKRYVLKYFIIFFLNNEKFWIKLAIFIKN